MKHHHQQVQAQVRVTIFSVFCVLCEGQAGYQKPQSLERLEKEIVPYVHWFRQTAERHWLLSLCSKMDRPVETALIRSRLI